MALSHIASPMEREAYIRQAAAQRGIDPDTAVRVAKTEGFHTYVGDQGRSFGDWQLFTGGGLGNEALKAGIDVRDPNTWRQQTDFALNNAAKVGWKPWYGARDNGIGRWDGIKNAKPVPSLASAGPTVDGIPVHEPVPGVTLNTAPVAAAPEAKPSLVDTFKDKGAAAGLNQLVTDPNIKNGMQSLGGVFGNKPAASSGQSFAPVTPSSIGADPQQANIAAASPALMSEVLKRRYSLLSDWMP